MRIAGQTRSIRVIVAAGLLGLLNVATSCEHIELATSSDADSAGQTNTSSASSLILQPPSKTGKGTAEAPYTVTQAIHGRDTLYYQDIWVIGYAVGDAYQSMKNANFTGPFDHTSNLLLAPDSTCTDVSLCLPIELKTSSAKQALAIANNASRHRQCLMIEGSLQVYLTTTGLRSISNYKWLGHSFTIPSNDPLEWEKDTIH